MVIREGDKVEVKTYVGNPRGVVKDVYEFDPQDPILLVLLETEEIIKCHASETEIIKEEPKPDTITIDRMDFKKALHTVITDISEEQLDLFTMTAIKLSSKLIAVKLENELFGKGVNNE